MNAGDPENPGKPGGPGGPGGPALLDTQRGVLAWFARNHVAANLLMILVLGGGLMAMLRTRQEVFPEMEPDLVTVAVTYRRASPQEVEQGVTKPVEEAIAGIEGIKRLRSIAVENQGTVIAELEEYADDDRVLDEIQAAVDRVQTFPEQIEDPIISEAVERQLVLSIYLAGDLEESALKALAEQVRDELTVLPGITQVDLGGLRRPEVAIEVSEEALRRYGLTFDAIADAVRRESRDLPGGVVRTPGGQVLIRTQRQLYRGPEFESVVVHTQPDGTVLRLGQIATVRDTFEESDLGAHLDGKPAAIINISRVGDQDAIEVAETVKAYVARKRPQLPAGVTITTGSDMSTLLRGRIDLLLRNAAFGLTLVFISLTLFLDLRLAFWTTLGIPISFLGAFWIMPAADITINMLSLFAFIIVLGIVVDDAIVVGENIYTHRQRGEPPLRAAILGVREMAMPVTFAVLTTVVAFLPLMFTAGQMGKVLWGVPVVVAAVLLISLVEALLILPAHLTFESRRGPPGPIARLQARVRTGLERIIHGPYLRTLRLAVRWRYATLAIGAGILMLTAAFVAGGHLPFVFFEDVGADNVVAQLQMPVGTPARETRRVAERIEQAAERVRQRLDAGRSDDERSTYQHVLTILGSQPFRDASRGAATLSAMISDAGGESHLAEVNIQLIDSESRDDLPADRVANLWREEVGAIPGVSSLVFVSSYFSTGEAISVELAHPEFDTLIAASEQLKGVLDAYAGVADIKDSFEPGKLEAKVTSLTEAGYALGVRLEDAGRQLRQGFFGEEAQRVQRGRDDVRVMVRYPAEQRRSMADLEDVRIRIAGAQIPIATVAQVHIGRGYAQIDRADQRRVITVTADVDEAVNNSTRINAELGASALPELIDRFPGLSYRFAGQQREQTESMESLTVNSVIALLAIFALLGIQFKSYAQPIIVMCAIPFGLVGAVIGHVLLGFKLSFLSGFGIVALTGVVVNDSLIMVDLINRVRATGAPLEQVIAESGTRRFRAIMLTTLTTFVGLMPMVMERSFQARFLVPMAISLAFGVLFATVITLLIVPTLYVVLEDIRSRIAGFRLKA